MVLVTAVKDFTFHGRSVSAGDLVEMEATEALVRSRKREVSLTIRHNRGQKPISVEAKAIDPDPPAPEVDAQVGIPLPLDPGSPRPSASARRRQTRHRYRRSELDTPSTSDLSADEET